MVCNLSGAGIKFVGVLDPKQLIYKYKDPLKRKERKRKIYNRSLLFVLEKRKRKTTANVLRLLFFK